MRELHLNLALASHPSLDPRFGVCPSTGVVYYEEAESVAYNDDYFLSEYESQYGRTYIADEEHLRKLARWRLKTIRRIAPPPGRLLEIGCATGFFLDEARKIGYEVRGIEISKFAASYARDTLGLDVFNGSLLDFQDPYPYNAVCAYYVLEHFPEQRSAFAHVASLLEHGGVLSFSLPSVNGPLLECSPQRWMETHPQDHFADYGPASLRRVLPLYGLRLYRTWPASYHPNRACGWKGFLGIKPLYRAFANIACYGDTMEGIALRMTPRRIERR